MIVPSNINTGNHNLYEFSCVTQRTPTGGGGGGGGVNYLINS